MAVQDKVRADTALKDFWRENERFADLFNGALFGGEKVLDPKELSEADTDVSTILNVSGYAQTLGRLLDVVKKRTYGTDFVIVGLENQMKVHYAMPLRNMIGDALLYFREYTQKAKQNKKAGKWESEEEFLSGLQKGERLHPVVTLCVYYGETAWDGPVTLREMLRMQGMPQQLAGVVNDYKMHLLQVVESEQCRFANPQVQDFFEIMRNIYRRDYRRIEEVYGGREISAELGLAIGAAAESKKLMNQALKKKGGMMNMCTALKELEDEGRRQGEIEGRRQGRMEGIVKTCKELGASEEVAAEKLQKECGLREKEAREYVVKYYRVIR